MKVCFNDRNAGISKRFGICVRVFKKICQRITREQVHTVSKDLRDKKPVGYNGVATGDLRSGDFEC